MIPLFNINNYNINTELYDNLLHGSIVQEFESAIAEYVGAKYAVSFNSATNAIFLAFLNKNTIVSIPSIIPPVVANALITSGNKIKFYDDINWVGDSYIMHDFKDYKIVDSAQKLQKNQFTTECNDNDLMLFSFYPTKPVGSCDGGIIVSNDLDKITYLKEMSLNGMTFAKDNWDRVIKYPGYKFYMNSIQADIGFRNLQRYSDKLQKLDYIKYHYNKAFGINNTSYHLYRINVKNNVSFVELMKNKHIQCGIHYKALHLNKIYSGEYEYLPKSETESTTTVSIPFHEQLNSQEISYIVETIQKYND